MTKTKLVHSLTVVLVLLLLFWTPGMAQAVSCAPLEPGLPGFELVVRGKIRAIPARGTMELAVSRYFRGSGPALLRAQVSGIGQGQRMDWMEEPRIGDEVVIALRREGTALVNTICNPFTILKPGEEPPGWVTRQFGQGTAPEGPPAPPAPRGTPRLWWLGGVLVAGLTVFLVIAGRRQGR